MFTIPSDETIRGCLVTKDVIDGTGEPVLDHGEDKAVQDKQDGQDMIEETA